MKLEKHRTLFHAFLALALLAGITSARADVEVSNLNNSMASLLGVTSNAFYSVSFTTGSNPGGYMLNDLSVYINDTNDPGFHISLEGNTGSNQPNDSLTFALNKQSVTNALAIYTASQALFLAPSTTYWVVASSTDIPSNPTGLITTRDSSYVANDGWTLGTTSGMWKTGGSWYSFSSPTPLMVGVNATAVPEPSSVALLLASLSAVWIFRRKLQLS